MKKYEFLEHTADVKFKAYGDNLEEAFENAIIATFDSMTDVSKIKSNYEKIIRIKNNDDKKKLLYDLLDEVIFIMDSESFLVCNVSILLEDGLLKATLKGDYQEDFKYDVHTYIKSVTYNEMEIDINQAVTIQVVHDI